MDLDANQLVAMVRRDDPAAVIELIELFYERIYAFLRRLSGNDADAADLTQHTFARVGRALPAFAGRSSPVSWIHGIAYHVYVDWRRASRPTESRSDEWWAACPSNEARPDELAANADLARVLYASVDALDSDLRETVHFHYYQGLTLQETADTMDVATSTVKYRLRQALAELEKKLSSESPTLNPQRLKTV
jgi:RNA polymerase sigma-70 factor (ECF subfamily)